MSKFFFEFVVKSTLELAPDRFKWTLHNLVAHPLGELYYVSKGRDSEFLNYFHDLTIPEHERGEGRG